MRGGERTPAVQWGCTPQHRLSEPATLVIIASDTRAPVADALALLIAARPRPALLPSGDKDQAQPSAGGSERTSGASAWGSPTAGPPTPQPPAPTAPTAPAANPGAADGTPPPHQPRPHVALQVLSATTDDGARVDSPGSAPSQRMSLKPWPSYRAPAARSGGVAGAGGGAAARLRRLWRDKDEDEATEGYVTPAWWGLRVLLQVRAACRVDRTGGSSSSHSSCIPGPASELCHACRTCLVVPRTRAVPHVAQLPERGLPGPPHV